MEKVQKKVLKKNRISQENDQKKSRKSGKVWKKTLTKSRKSPTKSSQCVDNCTDKKKKSF